VAQTKDQSSDLFAAVNQEASTLLNGIIYFLAQPKTQLYTWRRGKDAERRSKHHTKPALNTVRTIVIRGIHQINEPDGTEDSYKVKKAGWHQRRHSVMEHWRHYKSGKTVKVKAHDRGNEALGVVRYRVAPAKVFLGEYLTKKELSAVRA
jgi:hypothetical protein